MTANKTYLNEGWCRVLPVLIAICSIFAAYGQGRGDREQWMSEMTQYRHTFFTKELALDREQQDKFFPLYDEMEAQTSRLDEEARTMSRRIAQSEDATDMEYEKAAEAVYDTEVQKATIEREYLQKFKEILTPRQVFEIKNVERKFSRELMKQHHRIRSSRQAESK